MTFSEWMAKYHFPKKRKRRKKAAGFNALERKLHSIGYTSYEQYLSSPHWYQFWHGYYSFHPHVCFVTGMPATQLHHITYERLGNERYDDVVPVCNPVHELIHHVSRLYGVPLTRAHLLLRDVVMALSRLGLAHPPPPKPKKIKKPKKL